MTIKRYFGTIGITVLSFIIFSTGMALGWIIEPDNIIYGQINVNGIQLTRDDTSFIVTLELGGEEIASYTMGDMETDYYALNVPLVSAHPGRTEPKPAGVATAGDVGKIKVNGQEEGGSITLGQRGSVYHKDLSMTMVFPIPQISSVTPSIVKSGDSVTITGSDFGSTRGGSQVFFGTTNATSYISWSDTQISVNVPAMYQDSYASVDVKVKVAIEESNTRQITIDNKKPSVLIANPPDNEQIDRRQIALVPISGTASDQGSSIDTVEVKIDSGDWVAATGTLQWDYYWSIGGLPFFGDHIITARARDAVGNISEEGSHMVHFFIDTNVNIVYVSKSATGTGDGSSWENAFTTIQAGIDKAESEGITEVWVAKGTYYEAIVLSENIALYGGFNGNEIIREQREYTHYTSTIDALGQNTAVVINSYDAVLDRFDITNGYSNFGGGIYCSGPSLPTISNCSITNNSANLAGGGIYCDDSSSPRISNCIIADNSANWEGGGIYCADASSPIITNCTIAANSATVGSGIRCWYSSPFILNSILWNKSSPEIEVESGTPVITYSDIKGGYTGIGNINQDPLFIDPNTGDFHLRSGSPCIDAGDPNSLIYEDKEGIPRPQDGDGDDKAICDMGAYEYLLNEKIMTITAYSPVDLIVIDPDERIITKLQNQIPQAKYLEFDLDDDGDPDDRIIITIPVEGVYGIKVIPEEGADPADTYSLKVTIMGKMNVLTTDVKIQDIPSEGYSVTVISNNCEGDFDNDGDVDGSDLAVFAGDFGRTNCQMAPPCEGDFDNDGDVDGSDLAVFAGDFGRVDCLLSQ